MGGREKGWEGKRVGRQRTEKDKGRRVARGLGPSVGRNRALRPSQSPQFMQETQRCHGSP